MLIAGGSNTQRTIVVILAARAISNFFGRLRYTVIAGGSNKSRGAAINRGSNKFALTGNSTQQYLSQGRTKDFCIAGCSSFVCHGLQQHQYLFLWMLADGGSTQKHMMALTQSHRSSQAVSHPSFQRSSHPSSHPLCQSSAHSHRAIQSVSDPIGPLANPAHPNVAVSPAPDHPTNI